MFWTKCLFLWCYNEKFPSSSMGYISKNEASRRVARSREASQGFRPFEPILSHLSLILAHFSVFEPEFGPFWGLWAWIWPFLRVLGLYLAYFEAFEPGFGPIWGFWAMDLPHLEGFWAWIWPISQKLGLYMAHFEAFQPRFGPFRGLRP